MSDNERFIIKAHQLRALRSSRPLFTARLSHPQREAIDWVVAHFPRAPQAVPADWANKYANAVAAALLIESVLPRLEEFYNQTEKDQSDRSISVGEPNNPEATSSTSPDSSLTEPRTSTPSISPSHKLNSNQSTQPIMAEPYGAL
jgi:hypothetical protein